MMRLKIITSVMFWVFLLSGCAAIHREKIPAESFIPELKWNLDSYREFVKENIAEINANYSTVYVSYEFVVDTEYGSTLIQNLIDPESAEAINKGLLHVSNPEARDRFKRIYHYIVEHYDYIMDPLKWQSVAETLSVRKGDCKSLSLLLMSCLAAAGYETYAAISNGHMWVNVNFDNQWQVLELDLDPKRNTIYRIPGFYENPLYKIYPDRSEKRKRKN
jgi:transglutaminase-like putative cysteine protease